MNLKLVSEDSRRKLYEFGNGGIWKVGKYIEVNEDCKIGNHYHKNKDELFIIMKGKIGYVLSDANIKGDCAIKQYAGQGDSIYVPRNIYHVFDCTAGTVILGLATELHDDNDDLKL